ncbi:MAG: recombinase family protein [Candidatus Hatepunaea meridiana]|nr:recombinase family protein [Candidatus Hatepunaea meridiana]
MNNIGSTHFKPAIGYLRRSTDRQEQSIGDQRRVIEAYAVNNGYDLLNYYTDDAISGASSEGRAAFLQLIQDAKQRDCPFQFVLVYDIKRFGRVDNDEAGYYRYQLRRNGVEIIYVSENFNGDDTDDLLRPVKQWQARQELKDLSKVTIRGLLSRADGGWWLGGIPPFGYDLAYYSSSGEYLCSVRFISDGTKQVLDKDGELTRIVQKGESVQFTKKDKSRLVLSCQDRVKLIHQIFEWYVLEGVGYKSIAERLNKAGVPTPMGGRRRTSKEAKWCATTIMSILQNPVYTGDMVWNRLSFAKFHKISDGRAVQTRHFPGHGPSRNGQEDWIVHRNNHPAIITRTRFEQTQKRREATAKFGYANTHNVGRGARSPYLLTGLIHCSHCGHKWFGYTVNSGRKRKDGSNSKTLYYACGGYVSKGKSVCPRRVVRKKWLEGWVVEKIEAMLKKYFGTSEGLEKIRKMVEEEVNDMVPQIGKELDQVEVRIYEIKQTISNLIENLTSTNREYVDARLVELKRELAVLESKRHELEAAGAKKIEIGRLIDQAVELAGEFKTAFAEGTIEEKRLFLRAFLKSINLDPMKGTGRAMFILLLGSEKVCGKSSMYYERKLMKLS